MTNVPANVREMWTDLYKLFDCHYLMRNTEAEWKQFWDDARRIIVAHESLPLVTDFAVLTADFIGEQMKRDGRNLMDE